MHLGVGCAIENFVCAAHAFGIATHVLPADGRLELSPSTHAVLAARIGLGPGPRERSALLEAIPRRHTNRGPYRDSPFPAERLRELVDLASSEDVRVVFVSDASARRELSAVIVDATKRIIGDSEMSMDSFRYIRTGRRDVIAHRDGVTIDTSGVGMLMTIAGKMLPDIDAATTDRLWFDMTRDVHTATAPVFGMILVRDRLDMRQAIAAGRAWQRLHLAVTVQGLVAQPLNQPVEMIDRNQMLARNDEMNSTLVKLAHAEGWEPTFVFRCGHAERPAPPSPRRPLDQVISP